MNRSSIFQIIRKIAPGLTIALTVLLLGLLLWSTLFRDSLSYVGKKTWWTFDTAYGAIDFTYCSRKIENENSIPRGFDFHHESLHGISYSNPGKRYIDFAGLVITHWEATELSNGMLRLNFPFWIPLVPLLFASGVIIYRFIRKLFRKKHGRGFEVQVQQPANNPSD